MADKKEESPVRTTPTQGGRVLDRAIAHDGIGVGVPNFVGWVVDWAAGLARSGGYLFKGELQRPDYFANGPADRNLGGLLGTEGSMLIGQPLSEALGVGEIRTKTGAKADTGSLNVNVSYDSGKSWDKASLGEGAAHWGGQFVDPTLALPMVAAANKLNKFGKVAGALDKGLNAAGLTTIGLVVGHDVIYRGMILDPNEALDTLKILNKPKSLDTSDGANEFNRSLNFLLREFHDPINDKNRTTLFGLVKNKNANPDKLYIPSLDPDIGQLQTTVGDPKARTYRDNYLTGALEINKVIEQTKEKISDGKAKSKDFDIMIEGQKAQKGFNDLAQRYLAQGDKVSLSQTEMMQLHFGLMPRTYAALSPEKSETLKVLNEYLQVTYKEWSTTPGGQAAIRTGVQMGAITTTDKDTAVIPNANLNFMLQVQNNLLGREMKSTATAADAQRKAEIAQTEPTFHNAMGDFPMPIH